MMIATDTINVNINGVIFSPATSAPNTGPKFAETISNRMHHLFSTLLNRLIIMTDFEGYYHREYS
jgi:uncharacterized HAD superfamily protein